MTIQMQMIEIKEWESNIFCWAGSYFYAKFDYIPKSFISFYHMFLRFHSLYRENNLRVLYHIFRHVFLVVYTLQQCVLTRNKGILFKDTTEVRYLLSRISNYSMKGIFFTFRTVLMSWLYCTYTKI